MKDMILNETPLRTSVNFNINDIKINDVSIPSNINKFENLNINYDNSKVRVEEKVDDYNITYGLSEALTKSVQKSANNEIKIVIEKKLDLNILTVNELRDLAKKKEVSGYSKMKKDELIQALK